MQAEKRIALVTGGTRGIGAAISLALSSAGNTVISNYGQNDAAAQKFSAENNIPIYKWDVASYAECKHNVEKITAKYGHIDILVNNAGCVSDCMFHKMSIEIWNKVMNTNLGACFNMCNLIFPEMRKRNFGRIINISSINALKGQIGQANYTASKAAIIGFSKSLSLEGASKGITVNVIAPGYINTDMTNVMQSDIKENIVKQIPMQRMGEPNEIAYMVAVLAGESASFTTGATISINGGHHIW